jgi:formamidopyrimidine-DNA glycosylase
MPELPEVETIARALARDLVGATFTSLLAARADYVRSPAPSTAHHVEGRRVTGVRRHGKRLLLDLDRGGKMVLHLGMSGRISIVPAATPVPTHTHLRVALDRGERELRMRDPRRFGGVAIGGPGNEPRGRNGARLTDLGEDALRISLAEWRRVLGRPRAIKALLLDQSALAGLGNIYVDEILWASRIHPLARASDLSTARVEDAYRRRARILDAAIRAGGSTFRDYRTPAGDRGEFQRWHKVWGRAGEPCLRCGAKIRRTVVAGRATHTCPRCQRAPRARSVRPR